MFFYIPTFQENFISKWFGIAFSREMYCENVNYFVRLYTLNSQRIVFLLKRKPLAVNKWNFGMKTGHFTNTSAWDFMQCCKTHM